MKKEQFDKEVKEFKTGDLIKIHYRMNWRGGDGRPHDHTKGKEIFGRFTYSFNGHIDLDDKRLSYKSIKSMELIKKFVLTAK